MKLPETQLDATLNEQTPPLFNIGCGEDLSIAELAQLVADIVGFDGRLDFDASKPDGAPQKLLDISKTSKLGWRPRASLAEGLKLAHEDFCKHF